MAPRIGIGGVWHETNLFARGRTTLEEFKRYQYAVGEDLLERYAETGNELGGMIPAARSLGFDLVPTVFAGAVPSGIIAREAMDAILEELTGRLTAAGPLDGVLLVLHGAAVVEGAEDADAHVLARVRAVVGPAVPIVGTFDFHANLGQPMVAGADMLIGYDTFPHIDMVERGREAAERMAALVGTAERPACALRRLPLLTVPQRQPTGAPPLEPIFARLHAMEEAGDILCGSIAMGFPYSDVPQLGAAVLIYAPEQAAADTAAEELAHAIWAAREEFRPTLEPVDAAVSAAVAAKEGPVVLVEAADNVGGGSPGDGTVVLEALLRLGARGAVIVMADPEAVRAAESVGAGGHLDTLVGGKADDMHGPPVRVQGTVRFVREATYRHTGSYMKGYESSMGLAAVVDSGGVQIVLTSLRTLPFDAEQLRCVGIPPEEQHIIVVKSALAWRAAYGPMARQAIVVDTPGVCASNVERYTYVRCPRPIWPLDPDVRYPAD